MAEPPMVAALLVISINTAYSRDSYKYMNYIVNIFSNCKSEVFTSYFLLTNTLFSFDIILKMIDFTNHNTHSANTRLYKTIQGNDRAIFEPSLTCQNRRTFRRTARANINNDM